MFARKITFNFASCRTVIAIVCCAACTALLLVSCSFNSVTTKSTKAAVKSAAATSLQSSKVSQPAKPDFTASVVQQAHIYKSSAGRVALSMLICKIGSSYVYSDLVEKSAKELLDIVSEAAFENNITMESLDSRYGLSKILASEKIYVLIESNSVTSVSSSSFKSAKDSKRAASGVKSSVSSGGTDQWISQFQKAIRQPVKQ